MQLYKSTYVPILSYAAESWARTSKKENMITAAEVKRLRSLGKTRRGRCRNATVREQLKQETFTCVILRWCILLLF
jgi:hypothetical protein